MCLFCLIHTVLYAAPLDGGLCKRLCKVEGFARIIKVRKRENISLLKLLLQLPPQQGRPGLQWPTLAVALLPMFAAEAVLLVCSTTSAQQDQNRGHRRHCYQPTAASRGRESRSDCQQFAIAAPAALSATVTAVSVTATTSESPSDCGDIDLFWMKLSSELICSTSHHRGTVKTETSSWSLSARELWTRGPKAPAGTQVPPAKLPHASEPGPDWPCLRWRPGHDSVALNLGN